MKPANLEELVLDLTPRPALAREGWSRTLGYLSAGWLTSILGQTIQRKASNGLGSGLGGAINWLGLGAAGLGIFSGFSYRDPAREPLGSDPNFIYAPADGKIIAIAHNLIEPKFLAGPAHCITIASHLLDVHIQRAPFAGQVRYIFRESNPTSERANYLGLVSTNLAKERRVLLAQKINPLKSFRFPRLLADAAPGSVWVEAGSHLEIAQKIGLAGFGQPTLLSLYLPAEPSLDLVCKEGQHTQAGMTVLGRFNT